MPEKTTLFFDEGKEDDFGNNGQYTPEFEGDQPLAGVYTTTSRTYL